MKTKILVANAFQAGNYPQNILRYVVRHIVYPYLTLKNNALNSFYTMLEPSCETSAYIIYF